MKYRALGTTGINVSIIGLGTVKLGRNEGVKYPAQFKIPNDTEAASLISLAYDLGINLIDTAPAYGTSEERLGMLLKHQRKNWILCSKTGENFEKGSSSFDFSPEYTRYSIERSLQRLQTDYLDIVLIHSDGNDERIINEMGTLDALSDLKKQGKIRAIGVSTKSPSGSLLAAKKSDVVMLTYNLNERAEEPTLAFCQTNQKGVLVKKAFASGHLLMDGVDPVRQSMDFIFANPAVSSIIIGTISPQHLKHNVDAALDATTSTPSIKT